MTTAEKIPLEQVWAENANLERKLIEKEERLAVSEKKIEHLSQENNYLKEQLDWFKRQIFGK